MLCEINLLCVCRVFNCILSRCVILLLSCYRIPECLLGVCAVSSIALGLMLADMVTLVGTIDVVFGSIDM